MNIFCRTGAHSPVASNVWNDGYYFSECARCGREMIKAGGTDRWRPVPKNYRIVWKPRTEDDVDWAPGKAVDLAARPPLVGTGLRSGIQRPLPLRQLESACQARLDAPVADTSPAMILARLKQLQGLAQQ